MVILEEYRVTFHIPSNRSRRNANPSIEIPADIEDQYVPTAIVNRSSVPSSPDDDPHPEESTPRFRGCSPSCVGGGVLDLLARKPSSFPFRDACAVLAHCDVDFHLDLMKRIILGYSLKIHGLPECLGEDLLLAAYLFIEDVFGIETGLELCVRYDAGDGEPDVVGIVLDSVKVKRQILAKASCLEGTGIRISSNVDIDWILDGFCSSSNEM